jgi:hypothetical protein
MPDESVFQFTLGVFVLQVQEFEDEGVGDVIVGGYLVGRFRLRDERSPCCLRPFIELGSDLPVQLANGPARAKRFALVERPGSGVLHFQ